MNPRPINDYVLVERDKPARFSQSGLIIPPNADRITKTGKVIAIGNGRRARKSKQRISIENIDVGDRIIWVQQGVEKIRDTDGDTHIFVEEKYILAVIE